jgi:hypothetical protein
MAWFRKRQRLDLGTYVAPEPSAETSIAELIDEAMLIAAAGVRLAIKNLIILRSLRDHADYDEEKLVESVRQELHNMADEKAGDANRFAALRTDVQSRPGQPRHHDDYRFVDTEMLKRREDVSRGLADRLRALSEDEGYVRDLVVAARTVAWEEIAASLHQKLLKAAEPVDENYERYRDDRLLSLLGDLADLEASR